MSKTFSHSQSSDSDSESIDDIYESNNNNEDDNEEENFNQTPQGINVKEIIELKPHLTVIQPKHNNFIEKDGFFVTFNPQNEKKIHDYNYHHSTSNNFWFFFGHFKISSQLTTMVPFIITNILLYGSFVLFFIFVVPYFILNTFFIFPIIIILFGLILFSITIYFLYKTAFTDPGIIPGRVENKFNLFDFLLNPKLAKKLKKRKMKRDLLLKNIYLKNLNKSKKENLKDNYVVDEDEVEIIIKTKQNIINNLQNEEKETTAINLNTNTNSIMRNRNQFVKLKQLNGTNNDSGNNENNEHFHLNKDDNNNSNNIIDDKIDEKKIEEENMRNISNEIKTLKCEMVRRNGYSTFISRKIFKDIDVGPVTIRNKWCHTCHHFRVPRSSHCRHCNACIEDFDHHCPWVGNCVGKRNHRYFYLFLLSLLVLMIYTEFIGLTQCVIVVIRIFQDLKNLKDFSQIFSKFLFTSPFAAIFCVFVLVMMPSIIPLLCFHSFLICTNQTTYENINDIFHNVNNPYNKGITKNIYSRLFKPIPRSKMIEKREFIVHKSYSKKKRKKNVNLFRMVEKLVPIKFNKRIKNHNSDDDENDYENDFIDDSRINGNNENNINDNDVTDNEDVNSDTLLI